MKGVLAGTVTKKLQDVLEAAFCEEGVEDDDYITDEEEETGEVDAEEDTPLSKEKKDWTFLTAHCSP